MNEKVGEFVFLNVIKYIFFAELRAILFHSLKMSITEESNIQEKYIPVLYYENEDPNSQNNLNDFESNDI